MTDIRLTALLITLINALLISCTGNINQVEQKNINNNKLKPNNAIAECLKNILYYNSQVNESNYDSIATYYFHEILDYKEEHAQIILARLKTIETTLNKRDKYSAVTTEEQAKMSREMDSLRFVLSSYQKVVTGYVFVHTYSTGSDTTSVLVVMDNHCAYGEATPVKKIFNPNPADYSDKVRSIDNY